ncbi:MAG: hypothetical protein Q9164_000863 [Protoblastenia rupestris]
MTEEDDPSRTKSKMDNSLGLNQVDGSLLPMDELDMRLDQYGILKINEDIIVEGRFKMGKHMPRIKKPVKKERLVAPQKQQILRFQVFWIPTWSLASQVVTLVEPHPCSKASSMAANIHGSTSNVMGGHVLEIQTYIHNKDFEPSRIKRERDFEAQKQQISHQLVKLAGQGMKLNNIKNYYHDFIKAEADLATKSAGAKLAGRTEAKNFQQQTGVEGTDSTKIRVLHCYWALLSHFCRNDGQDLVLYRNAAFIAVLRD